MIHVTEVLEWAGNEELAQWRGRVGNATANKVQKEALKIGSALHQLVCNYTTGLRIVEPKVYGVKMGWKAAQAWLDVNKPDMLAVEKQIELPLLGLVATPDFVTTSYVVGDWKTSS